MSDIYDIFATPEKEPEVPVPEQDDFDPDAWKEKKQQERDQVYELIDSTALSLAGEGKLRQFLDIQSRMGLYSAGNVLLIQAQMPAATQLKDFESWQKDGAGVRRNERSFAILEPGKPYERQDGTVGTSYNVKKVFDISQTNAKPRQRPAVHHDDRMLIRALMNSVPRVDGKPVPVQPVDSLTNNMGAYYDPERYTIFVRRGMEGQDIFRCLAGEVAHAHLDSGDGYTREGAGFAAYCTSYILCRQNGIGVDSFKLDTAPEAFSSGSAQDIRDTLTEIHNTAKTIGERMRKELQQSRPDKQPEGR